MSVRRRLATVVGSVVALLGLAFILRPDLALGVSGSNVHLVIISLLALVEGARILSDRRATEIEAAETPDVERARPSPRPGDDFDRRLADAVGRRYSNYRAKRQLRDRLRKTAVDVLVWRGDCSEETARERIDAGTWTDDPYAVAFLSDERTAAVPLVERVRRSLSREPRFRRQARHAVDAIARIAETEDDR